MFSTTFFVCWAHDESLTIWRSEPDLFLPIVRVLCERIRALISLVAELSPRVQNGGEVMRAFLGVLPGRSGQPARNGG